MGEAAEEFVYRLEKERLTREGRSDLAAEVTWSSRDEGDGLGFDIRSFDAKHDEERFVEVKATFSGKYQPFFISENERAFSNDYEKAYRLYRVYQFRGAAHFSSYGLHCCRAFAAHWNLALSVQAMQSPPSVRVPQVLEVLSVGMTPP